MKKKFGARGVERGARSREDEFKKLKSWKYSILNELAKEVPLYLIMILTLKNDNFIFINYLINKAVLIIYAPGPVPFQLMF